ncbi:MAG TPA: hypothetical protein VGP50_10695 [Stellaceae bacterium]|jgi:hypothetical protein|nr:hypothetical protein [Stellaceae bacterium]
MRRLNSRDIDGGCAEVAVPPVWWPLVIVAVGAAAMLLLLGSVSFEGLDRLVPEGQPFLPYFTT